MPREPASSSSSGPRVEIRVSLKPGILDAEAISVKKALELLGVAGLGEVSTSRVYTLEFPGATPGEAEAGAKKAVERLLANPVIHSVSISAVTGR